MAMATMHEQVHERTGQKWQPDEKSEHVCAVLGKQQGTGDDQKSDQDDASLGFH
jgi:hypothetical protein